MAKQERPTPVETKQSGTIRTMFRTFGWVAGVVGFLASLVAVFSLFTKDLPAHQFALDCAADLSDRERVEQLQMEVKSFVDFVRENDGSVVYLEFEVYPMPSAGGCYPLQEGVQFTTDDEGAMKTGYEARYQDRLLENFGSPMGPTYLGENARALIEVETNQEAGFYGEAETEPSAWMAVEMVDPDQVAEDGIFVNERSPYLYYVSGPFIVRENWHKGYDSVSFVPTGNPHYYWREVSCSKKRIEWPSWARPFVPCW